MRADVRREYERWTSHDRTELAEIDAADNIMGEDIANCIPDAGAIGELTLRSPQYGQAISEYILGRLAERHALVSVKPIVRAAAARHESSPN